MALHLRLAWGAVLAWWLFFGVVALGLALMIGAFAADGLWHPQPGVPTLDHLAGE